VRAVAPPWQHGASILLSSTPHEALTHRRCHHAPITAEQTHNLLRHGARDGPHCSQRRGTSSSPPSSGAGAESSTPYLARHPRRCRPRRAGVSRPARGLDGACKSDGERGRGHASSGREAGGLAEAPPATPSPLSPPPHLITSAASSLYALPSPLIPSQPTPLACFFPTSHHSLGAMCLKSGGVQWAQRWCKCAAINVARRCSAGPRRWCGRGADD